MGTCVLPTLTYITVDRNDLYTQFRQLFLQFYDPLCKYAFTFVADKDASEDIVQDMFTRIWERHQEMITSLSIRAYLYKSVRNNSFTYLSKKNKVYSLSDWDIDEEDITEQENHDIPHYRELLKKAIDNLPAKCREVFLLSRSGNLSNQEIADNLGISVNTVNNQTWKAMKMLKAYVAKAKLWLPPALLIFFTKL
ncbi:RNA polymerase sigma-70 factor [Chitinophaga oryziterrae]|uniref:RNA polymerase sigma-70 factor n=1 Tax=Chitinophaga oryziterrae TaxID=1031224 RepID=A0A6N8JKH1_9BACT|nr:RNA polymerase sigma-70 factor [Chitinophaga oryziterrae]